MSNRRSSDVLQVTIREALVDDADALAQVAQLDSAEVPSGSMLVGESGGQIRAAVAIDSGRTIADPFHPTSELVALLHARAGQIRRTRAKQLRVIARSPAHGGAPALRGHPA
jgi:hypothetical protein